ncbi:MAG: NmrA family NAD(P)-binding protein [Aggregatilineales bacterium]
MTRILIAGGTGSLGSAVLDKLSSQDVHLRILSQQPRSDNIAPPIEWAQGNVITGDGLKKALAKVDIIVNCLGNPRNVYKTDVVGVQHLAEMAKTSDVQHFFHVSIVGIEKIELDYYKHKIAAENAVMQSGVPFSIQRITQFHTLLDSMMSGMQFDESRYTLPIAGDAKFQPIDTRDAAEYIIELLSANVRGKLPDVGGPEILTVTEIAEIYLRAKGITNFTLTDPENGSFPAPAVEGFKQRLNTVPDWRFGEITWQDYVHEHYS